MAEVRVVLRRRRRTGRRARVDVDGYRLARRAAPLQGRGAPDDWYVIGDRCSHADYSLSEGDVWDDEREIECPKHGSTFSLRTGEPQRCPPPSPSPSTRCASTATTCTWTLP